MQWENPPEDTAQVQRKGQANTQAFLTELRKSPGNWAKYPRQMGRQNVWRLNRRYPDIEWRHLRIDQDVYDVWGRAVEA